MTNYLSAEKLTASYHEVPLFEDLTFGVARGQKIALLGKNGSGKSTLLGILAGSRAPDSGVVVFKKGIRVGYLPQNPDLGRFATVKDFLFQEASEMMQAIGRMEQLLFGEIEDPDGKQYQEAVNRLDALQAWDYEAQIVQILGKLGINQLNRPVKALSGGMRKRVALAHTLFGNPDFLILDEPTNHLDIDAIEWLEQYLSQQKISVLMVTHDRYFLEGVTNEIIELEDGRLYRYNGNYAYFLDKKAKRRRQTEVDIEKATNLLRKELDWLQRMPKARGSKSKYRIEAAKELQEKAGQQTSEPLLDIRIPTPRLGKKILSAEGVSMAFDDHAVIQSFSHVFKRKDRIGIVGKNGTGKTTLLRLITGELTPSQGKIVVGDTVRFGHYRQEETFFEPGKRVLDIVSEVAEIVKTSDGRTATASQVLRQFLFPPGMHMTEVAKLSGGEKRRLQLLRVLLEKPNFLVLDEPTNDLDIYTLQVLEAYLSAFEGNLLVVSHDRYFMDKTVDHLFVLTGDGTVRDFPGNYTQFRLSSSRSKEEKRPAKSSEKRALKKKTSKTSRKRRSYHEQEEFLQLEKDIERFEAERALLVGKMNEGTDDHAQMQAWSEQYRQLSDLIDRKTDRWLELSEYEG